MTDTKNHIAVSACSLEGRVFAPHSAAETAEAVELAFDYRGDVTVVLRSGESVAGYIYNRHISADDSYLELFQLTSRIPDGFPTTRLPRLRSLGRIRQTENRGRRGYPRRNLSVEPKPKR
ncbi:MAG: hypothetical protein IPK92_21715 [Nitrospira sp.]|nr:hypothetical protein [Nitrospira sp.]